MRTLENEAKAFEGLDIPTLKANTQFLEEKGGTDAVIDAIAKAGGYESDIAKVTAEKDAQKVIADQASSDYEKINAENARLTLVNQTMPSFVSAFKGDSASMCLETAINSGMIVMTDAGVCHSENGVVTPLNGGGMELVKQNSMFKPCINLPSGGGEGGGINGNNNNNSGDDSLESLFE